MPRNSMLTKKIITPVSYLSYMHTLHHKHDIIVILQRADILGGVRLQDDHVRRVEPRRGVRGASAGLAG
jgi:hypothetical protein